ncbi:1125_t:CDS:2 [Paraglomus brasilianum]|uniref:1125_t:CDS:1 n=1 Tax=Paraglomus brasilianum TaxID=144538 RepID=A0A9N8ZL21_9GLOM|nr:1125_t:CDS:2 [Paraglomus brasilianum]
MSSSEKPNILTTKFKVHDDPDDKAFTIEIPWQEKVSKVKQRVKNKLATRLNDDDDIGLYLDVPHNLMEPEENFLKEFKPEDIERNIVVIIIGVEHPTKRDVMWTKTRNAEYHNIDGNGKMDFGDSVGYATGEQKFYVKPRED